VSRTVWRAGSAEFGGRHEVVWISACGISQAPHREFIAGIELGYRAFRYAISVGSSPVFSSFHFFMICTTGVLVLGIKSLGAVLLPI